MKNNWNKLIKIIQNDDIAIIPTDTIYGIVGKAFSPTVVERMYSLKKRDEDKPPIVLITDFKDLEHFGIVLDEERNNFLHQYWPGRLTCILPSSNKKIIQKLKYLHRGKENFALRMIGKRNRNLYNLIEKVGPIIAPSANPQDMPPANNIREAKKYFGDKIDIYIDGGTRKGKSSTIVSLMNKEIKILRQGDVKIKL